MLKHTLIGISLLSKRCASMCFFTLGIEETRIRRGKWAEPRSSTISSAAARLLFVHGSISLPQHLFHRLPGLPFCEPDGGAEAELALLFAQRNRVVAEGPRLNAAYARLCLRQVAVQEQDKLVAPQRPTTSSRREAVRSSLANCLRRSSPAWCPYLSFTFLKSSRSSITRQNF